MKGIRMKKNGFTLIELLVVISIIAVILGLTTANFLGARGRARDAKRKAEMKEVKNALRLYYNDYQSYPVADAPFNGCGVNGVAACPNAGTCAEFAAWTAGGACTDANATIYMKRLPRNPEGTAIGFQYFAAPTNDDFCLVTTLENGADSEIAVSKTRCASSCGTNCDSGNKYCMCAD
jgi:prepilin-type N-terminal cleavage/methylation domain-containing protein